MTACRKKRFGVQFQKSCEVRYEYSSSIKPPTLESGLNSRFLRILLKISVSSSCLLLSSVLDWLERLRRRFGPEADANADADAEVPGVAAAVAPAAPEESCPGSGMSTEGSSTCSISHSIA